jgi:hypothetical protein
MENRNAYSDRRTITVAQSSTYGREPIVLESTSSDQRERANQARAVARGWFEVLPR